MPRLKNCTICGREFLSHRGLEVCSEECKDLRRQKNNAKANSRRYHKEPFIKECPMCGKVFETVRRKYCSKECSEKSRKLSSHITYQNFYKEHREEVIKRVSTRYYKRKREYIDKNMSEDVIESK